MANTDDVARTARSRRTGLALAMMIAPWGFVLANGTYAWMTRHGGGDLTSAGALELAQAHRTLSPLGSLAAIVASLLMVPAVIGAMTLVRVRAARLGLAGGVMTATAYICYLGMLMQGMVTDAMAKAGGDTPANIKVLDAVTDQPLTIWVFVFFAIGNLIGTFVLGLALLRARTVPAWAAAGVLAWPVLHITGLALGSEWFETAGAVLQAAGFAAAAVALHRQPMAGSQPVTGQAYDLSRR